MIFLKEERKRLDLTQGDVAKICGVTIKAVSNWETGRATIKSTYLDLLSRAGFNTDYIITGIYGRKKIEETSSAELLDILEMILQSHEQQTEQIKHLITKIRG
ncbi:helix-turn-helix transcriptional regulator [Candidatus Albibeggiatoa sp. nov. BB20]|uniref:helix-turn-helix domain-containing protein n=1 Tax=Candidatus Albibeggiatoa sp. nov. BB20 TaxID=3162723 RepID=UPI003365819D